MFSTRDCRNFALAAAVFALPIVGGCAKVRPPGSKLPPPMSDRLNDAPLIVDEAMQLRNFEQSTALYADGSTVAGSTRTVFRFDRDYGRWNTIYDPVLGVVNIAAIPFTYFVTPPFKSVRYDGVEVPPTHHGMPPVE